MSRERFWRGVGCFLAFLSAAFTVTVIVALWNWLT